MDNNVDPAFKNAPDLKDAWDKSSAMGLAQSLMQKNYQMFSFLHEGIKALDNLGKGALDKMEAINNSDLKFKP
jgi:hypothetical protein